MAEEQNRQPVRDIFKKSISEESFSRLSEFITLQTGIKMPKVKKLMLEGRLRKRLRALGMDCFEKYVEYLFSEEGMQNEIIQLIDVVTTNKTDFFREPAHFDFLTETALPALMEQSGAGISRKLIVWSAGCATGEEPYTIEMVISDFAENYKRPSFDYLVLATDISTRVLEHSKLGIYRDDKIGPIPEDMKKKYLMRGKGDQEGYVRIIPELRSRIRFRRLNFMDDDFGFREPLDLIFCRNVIIYFDRPTQITLLKKIVDDLRVGGYLFIGHAETLNYMDIPIKQVAPSVYQKIDD